MRKLVVVFFAVLGLIGGVGVPTQFAHAGVVVRSAAACNGESVQKKPGVRPPFRSGKAIHFDYAEWHFPPSCKDDMRRLWVKVYRVKNGKDPKVYSTRGDRYDKTFKKGTYRVKVRYQYRYWKASSRSHTKWYNITKTKTVRIP